MILFHYITFTYVKGCFISDQYLFIVDKQGFYDYVEYWFIIAKFDFSDVIPYCLNVKCYYVKHCFFDVKNCFIDV